MIGHARGEDRQSDVRGDRLNHQRNPQLQRRPVRIPLPALRLRLTTPHPPSAGVGEAERGLWTGQAIGAQCARTS